MNWAGRRTYTYAFLVLLLAFLPDPSAPATCPRDIFRMEYSLLGAMLLPAALQSGSLHKTEGGGGRRGGGGQTPKGERASELGERESPSSPPS